jgi:hypothetical protein
MGAATIGLLMEVVEPYRWKRRQRDAVLRPLAFTCKESGRVPQAIAQSMRNRTEYINSDSHSLFSFFSTLFPSFKFQGRVSRPFPFPTNVHLLTMVLRNATLTSDGRPPMFIAACLAVFIHSSRASVGFLNTRLQ